MNKREEFKRFIILGCYPECKTYEDALEKESRQFGCRMKSKKYSLYFRFVRMWLGKYVLCEEDQFKPIALRNEIFPVFDNLSEMEIIGLPVTLARVLQALKNICLNKETQNIDEAKFYCSQWEYKSKKLIHNIWREYTKENGQECTDDDQTDETISKLLELLK